MRETPPGSQPSTEVPPPFAGPGFTAEGRIFALLIRLSGSMAGILVLLAVPILLAPDLRGVTWLGALSRAAIGTGTAGAVAGSVLLALAGQSACLLMVAARRDGTSGPTIKRIQGSVAPALAAIAGLAAWTLRPGPAAPAPEDGFVLAGILFALAFPALVAERMVAAIRPALLPEAASLRTLTLLPAVALGVSACVQIAMGVGVVSAVWVASALSVVIGLIALELAARGLAVWFLPPPAPGAARAGIDSLLAQMLAGSMSRNGLAAPIRARFGIDFSRSWALLYLRAAALPALALTALFCWGLTGLVMIGLDQRGVYERLGAPVAVLQPGLHLIPPWPLGVARRVELGAVHEIAIGGEPRTVLAAETTDAEGPPPASATRLWDQPHPGEVSTLVASETEGRQSFQTVNADIRILYRVGLTDDDALRAATEVADPDVLVRQTAGRRIARFFAVRTLGAILGDQREAMAESLRAAIAADLAPFRSGIEIVGVAVEAIHPPAGAASAYHAVQAAAIGARTAVAEAEGRAKSAANESRQEIRQLTDSAQAQAAENVQGAQAEAVRFSADRAAHAAGGRTFLIERYFADLVAGFAHAPLVVLDDRLAGPTSPILDLRPLAGAASTPLDDPD
jgi:regulator of protease activity HflC (stomatin/prohibitin superfamily)